MIPFKIDTADYLKCPGYFIEKSGHPILKGGVAVRWGGVEYKAHPGD